MVGPPRPTKPLDLADDNDDVMIGPPRAAKPVETDSDDDEPTMIGPPRPPVESDTEDENDEENRYRIPMSNEIVLKGHTKVLVDTV